MREFTARHNIGKRMVAEYETSKQGYLDDRRAYETRKTDFIALQKQKDLENSKTELVEGIEFSAISVEEKLVFNEQPPNPPATPQYPTSYWEQITKDTDRSLWKQVAAEEERLVKRDQLHRIISAVLCTTCDNEGKVLHYFQGYHDIAAVCLLTCGEAVGYSILRRLSQTYLRFVGFLKCASLCAVTLSALAFSSLHD